MDSKRKSYMAEYKLKVVLESMQRDTTQEDVCKKFGVSSSMLYRWRKEFQTHVESVFPDKRDQAEGPLCRLWAGRIAWRLEEDHRRIDGAEWNSKKSLGAVEKIKTAHKVELAHQLCRPHGPYSKSQVARALEMARGTLYRRGKQAVKDKAVATAIEQWHEQDDTMGHRKLAALRKHGEEAGHEEIRHRGSSQEETLCLSRQGEQRGVK
jgi:transposase-like protein